MFVGAACSRDLRGRGMHHGRRGCKPLPRGCAPARDAISDSDGISRWGYGLPEDWIA